MADATRRTTEAKLTNSYYPAFDAVVAKKMGDRGDDMHDENETQSSSPPLYPTDGEFSTDHSSSDWSGIPKPPAEELASEQPPQAAEPNGQRFDHSKVAHSDHASAYSPTENMTSHSQSEESCSLNLSDSGSRRDGEVSWSSSDGSTYVSESEFPAQAPLSKPSQEVKERKVENENISKVENTGVSTEECFDEVDLESEVPTKSFQNPPRAGKRAPVHTRPPVKSARKKPQVYTHKAQAFLRDIDIYPCFDEAPSNDGISVTRFISSAETEEIFCRGMVPLEIPVKTNPPKEDLSTVSSLHGGSVIATGDSLSVKAVHTRRGTTPRRRRRNEAQPEPALKPALRKERISVPLKFIAVLPRTDSMSSLGNESIATNVSDDEEDDGDDDNNNVAQETPINQETTEAPTTKDEQANTKSKTRVAQRLDIADLGINLPTDDAISLKSKKREKKESKTEERIKYLKERIRKMQVASTLETLPETRRDDASRSTRATRKPAKQPQDEKAKAVPTKKRASQSRPSDSLHRIQLQNVDYFEKVPFAKDNVDLSEADIQLSAEESSKNALDRVPLVPSQVTADEASDEVSAIPSEFEEIDLETGLRAKASRSKSEQISQKVSASYIKAKASLGTAARRSNSYLEQYPAYVKLQALVTALWMKYLHGRTQTERALVVVILSSVLILFILLIAIVAK